VTTPQGKIYISIDDSGTVRHILLVLSQTMAASLHDTLLDLGFAAPYPPPRGSEHSSYELAWTPRHGHPLLLLADLLEQVQRRDGGPYSIILATSSESLTLSAALPMEQINIGRWGI
jgi:hypothetical protein